MSAGIPLPAAVITRWTRHRKTEVVEGVRRERIPLAAAMRRWGISETYDRERYAVANKFKIRRSTLDAEVAHQRRRDQADGSGEDSAAGDSDPDEIELLDEPITLAAVLDEIMIEVKRYIVAPTTALAIVVLWVAHAHIVHHPRILLPRSPRLAIQAPSEGSGKTTMLEIVMCLVPRPRGSSSVTASAVFRVSHVIHPTWCLDEAESLWNDVISDSKGDKPSSNVPPKSDRLLRWSPPD